MQYLLSVVANGTESASPGEAAAIDAFNDRLRAEGYWVFGNGLAGPSAATVVDGRGEGPVFTDGPFLLEAGLAQVESLAEKLASYHAYHASRADILRRLRRTQESRAAYDEAIQLAANSAELAYLQRRRAELEQDLTKPEKDLT